MATQYNQYQIPGAQGYNPLIPETVSNLFTANSVKMLRDFYHEAPLANICNFEYQVVNDINSIPKKIINQYFFNAPDSIGWEEYYNNGENKTQNFDMAVRHQQDGRFLKFRIKLSRMDFERMTRGTDSREIQSMFREWQSIIRDMAIAKLHLHLWNQMEDRIMDNINPHLEGANAGYCDITHNYGTSDAPVDGTPESIINMIHYLSEDFIRGNIMAEGGEFYLKVPPALIRMLSKSELANTLMHHRTDMEGRQFSDFWVHGVRSGIRIGGAVLVPDYHMTPTAEGYYNIYAGWKENNMAKLYVTNIYNYEETTSGDQMVWLGMDAGFGCAVERDDVTALIKMQINEE